MINRLLGNPYVLSQDARELLADVARTLEHEWFEDACAACPGGLEPQSSMLSSLPPKHRARYDCRFARRFLVSLVVVVDRLGDPTRPSPYLHSTAEELAFRALLVAAHEHADAVDLDVHDELDDFYAGVVEDTDVDMLWDLALDGVEDPEGEWPFPGPANLDFESWFEPFGYVEDGWGDPSDES